MSTTTEQNKRIVRRIPDEVVNQRDLDALDEIFTEDAVDHSPVGESQGREAIKDGFEMLRRAFPDFSVTVDAIIAEGDTVAVRLTERGTHEGEFMGIDPTGQEVEFQAMVFFRLEDGKIAERWTQLDQFGLMQQVGVVESAVE